MLVRVLKRRTSTEEPFDVFRQVELLGRDGSPDLNLSVYEANSDAEALQLYAEHAASHVSPPGGRAGLEVSGIPGPTVQCTLGRACFPFARARHRELVFQDVDVFDAFGEQLYDEAGERRMGFEKAPVLDLMNGLREQTEWNEALLATPQARRWLRELDKRKG